MSVLDRIASLTPEQRALFEALREKQRKTAPPQPPPLRPVSGPTGAGDWPLTFDQERLWFLHQLDPASPAYNMVTATRLGGALDPAVLAAALNGAVCRHGAWRTTFPVVDGRPMQRVAPALSVPLPVIDLTALLPDLREESALALARAEARRPFSLETGPLVRASLLRLDEREHVCLLTVHHIVSDLISFQLFWRELALLYAAAAAGRPSPLPALPAQFVDFAVWQREWMTGEVLADELGWWRGQLQSFPLVLDLPADRPRPPEQTARGGRLTVHLDQESTEAIRSLARREGVTRFMALTALWATLLSRLSGQERLVTGTLNANRSRPEVEPLLGFFLTQLPLPLDLAGDPTVRELLARVRAVAVGAFAHQALPFGKLVEVLQPERDAGRMPLVQALVQLLDSQGAGQALGDLAIEGLDVEEPSARYDLMLALFEHAETISGPLEYNTGLLDATTVARWVEILLAMLATAAADPGARLSALPVFSEAARHQVLVEWNDTAFPGSREETVVDLFTAQASRTPEAVAWSGAGWTLSYAELEARSNRLARHLRRRGIGRGDLVGLSLERTADVPVALLGVLKSGAAYLPLDLAHPADRRDFMLADAGAAMVLTDTRPEEIAGEDAGPLPDLPDLEDRAYVIYTSGSSGHPKGVEIPHRSLAAFVHAMRRLYTLGRGDAMPGITTIAFDLSVPELYLPMLGGGTTPLLSRDTAGDGVLLARALTETGATVLQATPATYRMLLETGWTRSPGLLLLCGAEAMSRDLADRLLPLGRGLWNFYGPTETTVWSTAWRVEPEGPISIGRPIAGTRIHLLDRTLAPVPLGAVGEVAIGGEGMARGYFRRPELTAERFVPDPFATRPGERLYRTGDLARLRPDGLLDALGRADHQVKVRGFRIELGEIEAALRRHPAVSEAVVLRREDRPGDARLTAYLGLAPGAAAPDADELRRELAASLPDYMVPAAFVALPALPRNANGKVDRKALAEIRSEVRTATERVAPRTPAEELLAGIWTRVLDVEDVGVHDDFFALGGHSLLATQLVLRVRDAFGVELPLRSVFQAPTLEAQAAMIGQARTGETSPRVLPIRRVPRDGDLPLSFAQERLWFLDRLTPGSPAYNIPVALRVTGALGVPALERAFTEVVRRHETLRTTFAERSGRPVQVIAPPAGWCLVDTPEAGTLEAAQEAAAEALLPFDLEQGPLLRVRLLRLAPEEHVLLLTVHHIVADLWAVAVLIREVAELYAGRSLPDLPVQYADFAVWQREWLDGAELERQLAFWRGELAGAPPALELPTDRPRPPIESFRGASLPFAVGRALSASLAGLSRTQGATPFMTLTAALAVLLSRWSGQDDLVLGAPIANRQRPELEGLIGMFVNTLALRVRVDDDPAFADLLARVRRTALDAFEHQDLPFEKLVELQTRRDLSRHPVVQAVFAMQNVRLGEVELPGLTLAPFATGSLTTKFDLTVTLFETPDGLTGRLEYATDLFDATTVERLAGHLGELLAGIVAAPQTSVLDLPLLSAGELHQVLVEWNRPVVSREATIHGLVLEQAARTPDAFAVTSVEGDLTYAELAAWAGRLAARLHRLGLPPESRIGLVAERSLGLVAGLLGILQAGHAYLPLDPGYPVERLTFMLGDAGVQVLLGDRQALDSLRLDGLQVIGLDDDPEEETAPPAEVAADALAYVMYTSGSTGRPKGVAVTHRNVVRLVRGADYTSLRPEETFLQFAPVAFDASTLEIWGPLANGGRLALFPGRRASLDELATALDRFRVTSLWLTAGLFHQMVDSRLEGLRPLRQLLAGGDVLSPAHVRRALTGLPGLTLINGYGPTENTTFTCCHPMTAADLPDGTVPIGRPIAGTRVHVLDAALRPVPVGVWGELYAGGDGVARGYLNRPELTAERFIPDPFGSEPGGRLYRSGDLVRYRPGGVLEFLGRRDGQVKIRGFRAELGEIEAALAAHAAVREAAVVLREDRPGDRRLVAYVAPGPGADELRRYLAGRLPEPMVPSAFVVLDTLPLSPNGKVDRRALPPPDLPAGGEVGYVPPSTSIEEHLAAACAEVLSVARVGMRDNFFALGGHSLLATRFTALLRDRYGLEVSLQMVFDAADFGELADRIVDQELEGLSPDELASLLGEGPR